MSASSSITSVTAAMALLLSAVRRSTSLIRLPAKPSKWTAVAGHPDRRRLLQVESASPERIDPFCPHFGICGGCATQHWQAGRYRDWKRNIVVAALAQANIACEVGQPIDAHGRGRRRITVHARQGAGEMLKVGFAAASSPRYHSGRSLPHSRSRPGRRAGGGMGPGRAADIGRKAARHPVHRNGQRPRCRSARLGSAAGQDDRCPVAHSRAASPGPSDAPWRTGADADAADHRHRRCAGDVAAGLLPSGHRRGRGSAGCAGIDPLQGRRPPRRSFLRGRAVRLAAGREIARFSLRQRCAKPSRRCRRPRPPLRV